MKKEIFISLLALATLSPMAFSVGAEQNLRAQVEEDFFDNDIENLNDIEDTNLSQQREQEEKQRIEEEKKRQAEEERRKREDEDRAKREALRKARIKERKIEEAKAKELAGMREAAADTTEYTLDPSSVELLVEMDPNGYGFRTRNHRMTLGGEFDFLLRGRGFLHYDFRFTNFFSLGVVGGVDLSDMSLFSRFREQVGKHSPKQFSLLGGLTSRVRLSEWYMRSSVFFEPSLLFGHLWQEFAGQKTMHWRLRPGLFAGLETVFDSGLNLTTRVGVEFPIDFGTPNLIKERAEPLLVFGLGFAI